MSSEKITSKRAIGLAVGAVFFLLLLVYGYGYWKWKKLDFSDTILVRTEAHFSPVLNSFMKYIGDFVWDGFGDLLIPILVHGVTCTTVEIYPMHLGPGDSGDFGRLGGLFFESVEKVSIFNEDSTQSVLTEIGGFPNCEFLGMLLCPRMKQEELNAIGDKFPNLERLSIHTREVEWENTGGEDLNSISELFLAIRRPADGAHSGATIETIENLPEILPSLKSLHFYYEGDWGEARVWKALVYSIVVNESITEVLQKSATLEKNRENTTSTDNGREVETAPASPPFRIDPILEGSPGNELTHCTFLNVAIEETSGEALLRKYPKLEELVLYQAVVPVSFLKDLKEAQMLRSIRFSGALVENGVAHRIPPILISPSAEGKGKANQGETIVEWEELDDVRGLVERLRKEVE